VWEGTMMRKEGGCLLYSLVIKESEQAERASLKATTTRNTKNQTTRDSIIITLTNLPDISRLACLYLSNDLGSQLASMRHASLSLIHPLCHMMSVTRINDRSHRIASQLPVEPCSMCTSKEGANRSGPLGTWREPSRRDA
jgi:hypothetical protein